MWEIDPNQIVTNRYLQTITPPRKSQKSQEAKLKDEFEVREKTGMAVQGRKPSHKEHAKALRLGVTGL